MKPGITLMLVCCNFRHLFVHHYDFHQAVEVVVEVIRHMVAYYLACDPLALNVCQEIQLPFSSLDCPGFCLEIQEEMGISDDI